MMTLERSGHESFWVIDWKNFLWQKEIQKNDGFFLFTVFNYLSSCACHENRAYDSNKYFNNVSTFTIVEICRVISDFGRQRDVSLMLTKWSKTTHISKMNPLLEKEVK